MPASTRDGNSPSGLPTYSGFLDRLQGYERVEPFPQSRRPDKLAGVRWLLERLSHPERSLRVVHVAGTNGKGMTCAMIAALLQSGSRESRRPVGLYTSPHVVDLRERIMLDGAMIDEAALAAAGHRVLDLADAGRGTVYFSYFDILTAIGLFAFSAARCEWAVLETGIGGLSDATNAVDKELAVVTSIGFDHMAVLGHTLCEIAEQKLGIVRAGVSTVLAPQQDVWAPRQSGLAPKQTELAPQQAGLASPQDASAMQEPGLEDWMAGQIVARGSAVLRAGAFRIELSPPPSVEVRATWPDGGTCAITLPGASLTRIKALCAANALCAAEQALGPARGEERSARLRTAMATELPGRLERRIHQRIRGTEAAIASMVLDGGHNAGALDALADELERWGVEDYTLIIGLQADKLVDQVRPPLRRLLSRARRILILAPQTARAPTTEALLEFLRRTQAPASAAPIEVHQDPRSALLAASRTPDVALVATGSFWMLGDLMRLLEDA